MTKPRESPNEHICVPSCCVAREKISLTNFSLPCEIWLFGSFYIPPPPAPLSSTLDPQMLNVLCACVAYSCPSRVSLQMRRDCRIRQRRTNWGCDTTSCKCGAERRAGCVTRCVQGHVTALRPWTCQTCVTRCVPGQVIKRASCIASQTRQTCVTCCVLIRENENCGNIIHQQNVT